MNTRAHHEANLLFNRIWENWKKTHFDRTSLQPVKQNANTNATLPLLLQEKEPASSEKNEPLWHKRL